MRAEWLSVEANEWRAVLGGTEHDFYHLPGYVALCGDCDGANPGAIYVEDGEVRLLWPMLERPIPASDRVDLVSPYGYPGPLFVGPGSEARREWLSQAMPSVAAMLRQRGAVSLFARLHPLLNESLTSGDLAEAAIVEHGATVSLDLGQSSQEARAQYRKSTRYEIRAAERAGWRVRRDEKFEHFDEFQRLYVATMKRVGASAYYTFSPDYFHGLRVTLGEAVSLWLAEKGDVVGAAALFVTAGSTIQYHLSGTNAETASEHPTKLMIDAVREWGHERAASVLHLGGGVGGSTEDALFFFKSGFSPRRHRFRTLRAVIDDEAYDRLSAGAPATDFFPRYRVPADAPDLRKESSSRS